MTVKNSNNTRKKTYPGWFIGVNVMGGIGILSYYMSHGGLNIGFMVNILGILVLICMGAILIGKKKEVGLRSSQRGRLIALIIGTLIVMIICIGVFTSGIFFRRPSGIAIIDGICFICTAFLMLFSWKNLEGRNYPVKVATKLPITPKKEKVKEVEPKAAESKEQQPILKWEEVKKPKEVSVPKTEPEKKVLKSVDINFCTAEELAQLPGISMVAAKRIIEIREAQGEFRTVDEFMVKAEIKPHFAVQLLEVLTVSVTEKASTERPKARRLDI